MNRTTKIALLAGAAVLLGGGVFAHVSRAQEVGHDGAFRHGPSQFHHAAFHRGMEGQGRDALFEQFDTNKDGVITQDEIDQARKERFAKFDTNKDGKLSLKEYETLWLDAHHQQMVRDFQHTNTSASGLISSDEYLKPTNHLVEHADRNLDGKITKDDFSRPIHHDHAERTVSPQGGPGGQPTPPAPPAAQ